ncbi:unnamed protein product [Nesidiocoris tenuis]|uniref:Uncharacterized protein n=1 Tax=Nesidiocoris tenuis TaxID=355587 RepID=A0A6H5HDF7_9HEMI|nr:unnamed protein product [Nesidiocoris tenuis]
MVRRVVRARPGGQLVLAVQVERLERAGRRRFAAERQRGRLFRRADQVTSIGGLGLGAFGRNERYGDRRRQRFARQIFRLRAQIFRLGIVVTGVFEKKK